jgi:hypothetical protein
MEELEQLVGLLLRPILESGESADRGRYFTIPSDRRTIERTRMASGRKEA